MRVVLCADRGGRQSRADQKNNLFGVHHILWAGFSLDLVGRFDNLDQVLKCQISFPIHALPPSALQHARLIRAYPREKENRKYE